MWGWGGRSGKGWTEAGGGLRLPEVRSDFGCTPPAQEQ